MKNLDIFLIKLLISLIHKLNNSIKRDCYAIYAQHSNRSKIDKLSKNLNEASLKWKEKRIYKKNLKILHDISYNYWVRGYAAEIYNRSKISYLPKQIFLYLYILFCLPITIISWIKDYYFTSKYVCGNSILDTNEVRGKNNSYLTSTNEKKLKRLKIIQNSSAYEIIDGSITSIFLNSSRDLSEDYIFTLKCEKISLIKNAIHVLIYVIQNPCLWPYKNKLLDSLILYKFIRNNPDFKSYDSFHEEVYCFNTRAVALATIDNGNKHKLLEYMAVKDYYDIYYLHRSENNNFFYDISKDLFKNKSIDEKDLNSLILTIQASDTMSNLPTLYEFSCYNEIIKNIIKDVKGAKVYVVFHPGNSRLSVSFKKYIWKRLLRKLNFTNVIYKHKKCLLL